ncbi:MAG TPA: PIG-L family deacetylase [Spirochaetia bacterium]|nr:PIG-L family deacetylase [Spirochaetia bacterium]
MKRFLWIALLVALVTGPIVAGRAQVRRVYDRGATGLLQQIEKLRTTASVLVIGAHPDDEDSAFIARAARGDHARVAYLSLNRGEGGQNVIGPEQYDALGVIRTEELLQARALDGGEQFFARTYDFGFSKTMEEASRLWGEREVLRDMVRVIREFRPLVVYSVFSGTPADGHGHHQLAGKLAPQAYRLAGDPGQFPEQITEGLRPWRPLKLYRAAGPGETATTVIETGGVDPLLGRSYAEIAAEGRSQHKSQAQGTEEVRGPVESGLVLLDSAVPSQPRETSAFAGIDTSIPGLSGLVNLPPGTIASELEDIDGSVQKALSGFDVVAPAKSVQDLAHALEAIRAARAALQKTEGNNESKADADFILAGKEKDAAVALQEASGAVIDALSATETVAPGESFTSTVKIFLADPSAVKIERVDLRAAGGWSVHASQSGPVERPSRAGLFEQREVPDQEASFVVTVPKDAAPTQPYWLTLPRKGSLYTWPEGSPKGKPFGPPMLVAEVQALIGGAEVTLTRPVQYRFVDSARGELRRNVDVVPAVSVSFDSPLEIAPRAAAGRPRRVVVRLQSNSQTAVAGSVKIEAPSGWTVSPSSLAFAMSRKGEHSALAFEVTSSTAVTPGRYALKAVATAGGREFDLSMRVISYPHIQTHRIYAPAEARVEVVDLKVAPVKIGYIMGSGDLVPEALRRMGLSVTLLDEDALAAGDLSRFDTIVVGIRASEVRADFVAANERLLDYVRSGGTLIVQYQQGVYASAHLAPLPVTIGSRVTDENAPVTILAPDNPVFTTPNRIRPDDFDGWVQDRNLYAFTTFDPAYVALLECHDPGESPQKGGEVYLRLGKGNYVYTSYAWFRQLPAGVPGAYRLFANLVSLGYRGR